MFNWCQTVNIYNIENHYYYNQEKQPSAANLSKIAPGKLRPDRISITTQESSKKNSKSKAKKGIALSKGLELGLGSDIKSMILQNTASQFTDKRQSVFTDNPSSLGSTVPGLDKLKTAENEVALGKEQRYSSMELAKNSKQHCQKIDQKPKPLMAGHKLSNIMLLSNIYQNGQASSTVRSKNQTGIPKIDIHQLTTSRNFQQPPFINESSHSRNQRDKQAQQNFAYRSSHTGIKPLIRLIDTSRRKAQEASIILSNILSQDNDPCTTSAYKPSQSTVGARKKLTLWQDLDKQTIMSQQNADSRCSLRIEESYINDLDPKNNFHLLPDRIISTPVYTSNLAVEQSIQCLVSLKEVGFREMGAISQQLQMYQFIEQELHTCELYCHILQLYQVQMTNGSYIFIKQPYTRSCLEHCQSQDAKQSLALGEEIREVMTRLLMKLDAYQIYPTRAVSLFDFVICENVLKLHDLSIFKQMQQPVMTIEAVLANLEPTA